MRRVNAKMKLSELRSKISIDPRNECELCGAKASDKDLEVFMPESGGIRWRHRNGMCHVVMMHHEVAKAHA